MNILIAAHELSPKQGSECAEGWNIVKSLAHYKDLNLTVIYARGSQYSHDSYVNAIAEYYSTNRMEDNINFIAVSQPKLTILLARFNRFVTNNKGSVGFPIFYFWGYNLWQRKVYRVVKDLMDNEEFDLIHHLTQITFREPGYLWKLDLPFVWGPTGGLKGLKMEFVKDLSLKQKCFELIRNVSNYYQFNLKRRVKNGFKKSKLVYSFSKEDLKIITKLNSNVKVMLDAGTYSSKTGKIRTFSKTEKLRLIWAGQLIERKGFIILIQAIAQIKDVNSKLEVYVLGEGPLRKFYEEELIKNSLTCVKLLGKVEHSEVSKYFFNSHLFIHTSFREAATHVVPEALSTGLPIICHDSFGLSIAVDQRCGIKIPFENIKTSIDGFRKGIERILENPKNISILSSGAIERSHELSWDKMAEEIHNDYQTIINNNENSSNK